MNRASLASLAGWTVRAGVHVGGRSCGGHMTCHLCAYCVSFSELVMLRAGKCRNVRDWEKGYWDSKQASALYKSL